MYNRTRNNSSHNGPFGKRSMSWLEPMLMHALPACKDFFFGRAGCAASLHSAAPPTALSAAIPLGGPSLQPCPLKPNQCTQASEHLDSSFGLRRLRPSMNPPPKGISAAIAPAGSRPNVRTVQTTRERHPGRPLSVREPDHRECNGRSSPEPEIQTTRPAPA